MQNAALGGAVDVRRPLRHKKATNFRRAKYFGKKAQ
jgi:hypothetical protein